MPAEKFAIPAVDVIIEHPGEEKILMQLRWKPELDPLNTGTWELPGGKVTEFEDIFQAVRREAFEETGLSLYGVREKKLGAHSDSRRGEKGFTFKPFLCWQTTKGRFPYICLFFIAKGKGMLRPQQGETRQPEWKSLEEVQKLLKGKKVYPLHVEALKEYLRQKKSGKL